MIWLFVWCSRSGWTGCHFFIIEISIGERSSKLNLSRVLRQKSPRPNKKISAKSVSTLTDNWLTSPYFSQCLPIDGRATVGLGNVKYCSINSTSRTRNGNFHEMKWHLRRSSQGKMFMNKNGSMSDKTLIRVVRRQRRSPGGNHHYIEAMVNFFV